MLTLRTPCLRAVLLLVEAEEFNKGPLDANTCYEMVCDPKVSGTAYENKVQPTCEKNLSTFNSAVRKITSGGRYSIVQSSGNICPPLMVTLPDAIGHEFTWVEGSGYHKLHVEGSYRDGKDAQGNTKYKKEYFDFYHCSANRKVPCY